MSNNIIVGSKVKHKTGFEGVVELITPSYTKVRITKGNHPYSPSKATYDAEHSFLTLIETKIEQLEVGSYVKHNRHDFEGVVEMIRSSFIKVRITKGSHPFDSGSKTYEAIASSLTILAKPLVVGAYVEHRSGYKGVVEEIKTSYIKVRITEGSHQLASSKGVHDAHESYLTVIASPKEHFENLLKDYKAKVDKANAEARTKADELAKAKAEALDDSNRVMEIEMNGMKIKTDYLTFKKMVADYSK